MRHLKGKSLIDMSQIKTERRLTESFFCTAQWFMLMTLANFSASIKKTFAFCSQVISRPKIRQKTKQGLYGVLKQHCKRCCPNGLNFIKIEHLWYFPHKYTDVTIRGICAARLSWCETIWVLGKVRGKTKTHGCFFLNNSTWRTVATGPVWLPNLEKTCVYPDKLSYFWEPSATLFAYGTKHKRGFM